MADNNGISGGLEQTTLPLAMTLGAFTAIAWYNVIDLNVLIWFTFKRRSGLYFYSLLLSSWGIMIYALAFLMKFFQVWKNNYVSVTFITIGWYAMVTGQSLVLYSRLHLVVYKREQIRWILYMIIIDIFLFHIPTTVLTFGVCENLSGHTFLGLRIHLGKFATGGYFCHSIFDHGKDSSHWILYSGIYHLWSLCLCNKANSQTRRGFSEETFSAGHVTFDLRQHSGYFYGCHSPLFRVCQPL